MFERFTEHARRTIFFARYEASAFGSEVIETEHLLLGILREDQFIRSQLGFETIEQIRHSVTERTPTREKTSTSVDLPLSHESKRALAYADEESKALNQKIIDCGHLVLGLLRLEKCAAAALLREHGIEYASYRVLASVSPRSRPKIETPSPRRHIRPTERPNLWEEESKTAALSLQVTLLLLEGLLDGAVRNIDAYSQDYGEALLKRKPWSRKQALGHLTDWAITHQQWLARALTGPTLIANGYPTEEWVSAQQYGSCSWPNIVDLWLSANRLLVHVLSRIPEEKLSTACRIGIDEPIPLSELIARYVEHCEDVLGQILARL